MTVVVLSSLGLGVSLGDSKASRALSDAQHAALADNTSNGTSKKGSVPCLL